MKEQLWDGAPETWTAGSQVPQNEQSLKHTEGQQEKMRVGWWCGRALHRKIIYLQGSEVMQGHTQGLYWNTSLRKKIYIKIFLCVFWCGMPWLSWCMHGWRLEDNLWGSVLSFHHVGPGNQAQAWCQALSPCSHITHQDNNGGERPCERRWFVLGNGSHMKHRIYWHHSPGKGREQVPSWWRTWQAAYRETVAVCICGWKEHVKREQKCLLN